MSMNKQEAMFALLDGKKLTHRYFNATEYVYLDGQDIIDENGCRISEKEFWNGRAWDNDWDLFTDPIDPIILQSPDMVVTTYTYKSEFVFQRLLKDQKWYVTYKNHIIAHGMYRHDLEEWIESVYFINERVGRTPYTPEIQPPPLF